MSSPELLIHPLVVRTVEVVSTEEVDGRVQRIRLEGPQLAAFERHGLSHPAFTAPGFDDHIKVIFAADGDIESALPRQHVDGIEWLPSEHRQTRDYTPHSVDPETGAFSLDFVLHGEGPAVSWARQAVPGSTLSFAGPKSSLLLPSDATSIVLIGDETALPAIERFLTERPMAVPAHVVVLVSGAHAPPELPIGAADSLRLEQMREPDGAVIAAAFDSVYSTEELGERPFVWAAAESRSLLPLRRRLTGRVEKTHRSITGYWHLQAADVPGTGVPDLPEPPVAWLAVRAALQTGLLDSLRDTPRSIAELTTELGVRGVLDPLVAVLAAAELIESQPDDRWALTDLAVELVDDSHEREEFTGVEADQVLALRHLDESIRTGTPAWQLASGKTFAEAAHTDPEVAHHLEHESGVLVYLQHGLRRALGSLGSTDIVVVGPGAGLVTWLADGGVDGVRHGTGDEETGEVVVSAMLLSHLSDESAVEYLRGLAGTASRALIIDSSAPEGLYGAAEATLLRYVTTGTIPRSQDRVGELARSAGWSAGARHALGWGVVADELVRDDAGDARR